MTSPVTPTWKPDALLRVSLNWAGILGILFWLPLIRATMDGPSYSWGLGLFSGAGMSGDYWFPVLGSVGVLLLLYGGWRGKWPVVMMIVLLCIHLFLLALSIYFGISEPDALRFRGDTLGIDFSLTWILVVLFAFFSGLISYWLVKKRSSAKTPLRWTRLNVLLSGFAIALLPLQYFLLREPNGTTDPAGVIVTIAQWILLTVAIRPFKAGL